MRKVANLCEKFGGVSTCSCPKYIKRFVFTIWEMVEKIKTDADRLLLVLIMKKYVPIYFAKNEFFYQFRNQK